MVIFDYFNIIRHEGWWEGWENWNSCRMGCFETNKARILNHLPTVSQEIKRVALIFTIKCFSSFFPHSFCFLRLHFNKFIKWWIQKKSKVSLSFHQVNLWLFHIVSYHSLHSKGCKRQGVHNHFVIRIHIPTFALNP